MFFCIMLPSVSAGHCFMSDKDKCVCFLSVMKEEGVDLRMN